MKSSMIKYTEGEAGVRYAKDAGCRSDETLLEAFQFLQIDTDCEIAKTSPAAERERCSRNALRKQRHWEKIVAARKSKRKKEKVKKKKNHSDDAGTTFRHSKRFLKALTKERLLMAKVSGPKLCLDLSMTGHMTKKMDMTEENYLDLFPTETIVYLTPDSEQALEDIDPHKVYILGGLVDESIKKKLTFQKAQENGLLTARLPIQECMVKNVNMKNYHSEILAINQVFDVLSTYYETQSWPEALKAGVPCGNGFVLPDTDE